MDVKLAALLLFGLASCGRLIPAEPVQDGSPPFVPPPVTQDGPRPTVPPPPIASSAPVSAPATPAAAATGRPLVGLINEDPSLPRSQYELKASLDYDDHEVDVDEALTYVNRTSEPLPEIVLMVEPNRRPGAFTLHELSWADGTKVSGYRLEGGILTIPLPEPLPPWKSLGLRLEFTLSLPAQGGTFGYSERQLNLGDWYAFAPLYRPGHGWLAHTPADAIVGEHLTYDIADYQVEIRLENPPAGLILAGSAPPQESGEQYRFQVQGARNFTLTASPFYEVIADETSRIPVTAYVFPEHLAAGEAAVAASGAALDLFSQTYGEIPRAALTIVEGEFADGMEYDGLYFLSRSYFDTYFGGPQNFLTTLAVHETAHLWWAGLVANDQALEPWLDEALCTFSELLYFERHHPDLTGWWWEFRVALYEPEGPVDSTIYDSDGFRPYINAVYLRGVSFLQAARDLMGDEAFFSGVQTYLRENSYGDGTTGELLEILAAQAPGQLDPLIDEYFRGAFP